jgi:hypothetical protein
VRERGGYKFGLLMRWHARPYLLGFAYVLAVLGWSAWSGFWGVFLLILGLFLGLWLRDFGFIIASKQSWPFLNRVIDWHKVEQIAHRDGQP